MTERMMERVYVLDHEDGTVDFMIYWHTDKNPHEGWMLSAVKHSEGVSVLEFAFVEMQKDQPFILRAGTPIFDRHGVHVDNLSPWGHLNVFDKHIMDKMLLRAIELDMKGIKPARKSRLVSTVMQAQLPLPNPTRKRRNPAKLPEGKYLARVSCDLHDKYFHSKAEAMAYIERKKSRLMSGGSAVLYDVKSGKKLHSHKMPVTKARENPTKRSRALAKDRRFKAQLKKLIKASETEKREFKSRHARKSH